MRFRIISRTAKATRKHLCQAIRRLIGIIHLGGDGRKVRSEKVVQEASGWRNVVTSLFRGRRPEFCNATDRNTPRANASTPTREFKIAKSPHVRTESVARTRNRGLTRRCVLPCRRRRARKELKLRERLRRLQMLVCEQVLRWA